MYETFTKDFGLDNLIWVYSPNVTGTKWVTPLNDMYPDDAYVDVVGTDIYIAKLLILRTTII